MPFAEIVIADCNLAVRSSAIPKVARNALSASYSLRFVRYFVSVSPCLQCYQLWSWVTPASLGGSNAA